MTPDEVNHSQAGNVFMLGSGGIFGMCTPKCIEAWFLGVGSD